LPTRKSVWLIGGTLGAIAIGTLVTLWLTTGRGGVDTDGPIVSHDNGWFDLESVGLDALVGGTLELDDGCLLLSGDAVVWPGGTQWNEEDRVLTLENGDEAYLGDSIQGGGGVFGGPEDDDFWPDSELGMATSECQRSGAYVVVFNIDEPLEATPGRR